MNEHKLRAIVELVRRQGPLPTDEFGQILSVADLLEWYGLAEALAREERACVIRQLSMMREAQVFMERLQQKAIR